MSAVLRAVNMRKILDKSSLFDKVTRLVDVAAIALIVIDSPQMEQVAEFLELSPADIKLISTELHNFFEGE